MKANTTYKIVVDKDLSSNNSSTLGSNVEIFFTTEIASSGGGSSNSNTGVPPVNNVVDTQTTINGSTVTASVKADDIISAIAQSAAEATKTGTAAKVTLNVAAPENTRNVQLSVPTATLSAVASSDVIALTVATPVANIDFDSKSLRQLQVRQLVMRLRFQPMSLIPLPRRRYSSQDTRQSSIRLYCYQR